MKKILYLALQLIGAKDTLIDLINSWVTFLFVDIWHNYLLTFI